jgi:uncharacterized protein (TIGR03085 family)
MDSLSRTERASLCDLLDEVGPDAPTLCAGWTTSDLAAHLRLREGNPFNAATLVLPRAHRLNDRGMTRLKSRLSFAVIIDQVRHGPPVWSPLGWPRVEPAVNTVEFFVHHEDVLRAVGPEHRRELPTPDQDVLWSRIRLAGKVFARTASVGLELVRTDVPASLRIKDGHPSVAVRGLPSELTLYLYGRSAASDVELEGASDVVATLT